MARTLLGAQAYGKLFHSGMPHLGINPMELCMEALSIVQRRFYEDYPPHPNEKVRIALSNPRVGPEPSPPPSLTT